MPVYFIQIECSARRSQLPEIKCLFLGWSVIRNCTNLQQYLCVLVKVHGDFRFLHNVLNFCCFPVGQNKKYILCILYVSSIYINISNRLLLRRFWHLFFCLFLFFSQMLCGHGEARVLLLLGHVLLLKQNQRRISHKLTCFCKR